MINVVGNGLAGSIVTRFLRDAGYSVRVIADDGPNAASFASSNLYIEHWVKKFAGSRAGLEQVAEKWGEVSDEPFQRGLGYAAKVKHIGWEKILCEADVPGLVTSVDWGSGTVRMENGDVFEGEACVLCLGWRNAELTPRGHLQPEVKAGHCLLFEGRLPEGEGTISMLAPYRHQKWYQLDEKTIYYADSTALKRERYEREKEELIALSKERAEKLNKGRFPLREVRTGYRPVMKGHDFGIIYKVAKRCWVVNGGGKNGIVAYAACADRLLPGMERTCAR